MRLWALVAVAGLSAVGQAQVDPWNFRGQFPQFRDLSGLPGSGFGVNAKGLPSIRGAMALSTPIGFSLGSGLIDVGISSRSVNSRPQFFNLGRGGNVNSDGTLQVMAGLGTPIGTFTGSFEVVSTALDSVLNLQYQLPLKLEGAGVSIGVQNLANRPHAASDRVVGEDDLSRSYFAVGSYEFSPGNWVSLGLGDVRFKGVFGSVSVMAAERLKVMTEYDTFGWNTGVAYSLGRIPNIGDRFDRGEVTVWAGLIQGRRATIALNYAF
jgi:hypothetical protein